MIEQVLVVPAARLHTLGRFEGFSGDTARYLPQLLDPAYLQFMPRPEAEEDPTFKQLIPYLVLRHEGRYFHYTRSGGGEKRLHARRSIGIGGHICSDDGAITADVYRAGMERELREEVHVGAFQERIIGLINDDSSPVGRVHVGIVHVLDLERPEVTSREEFLVAGGFATLDKLRSDRDSFETWSRSRRSLCPS